MRGSIAIVIPCVSFRVHVSEIFGWLVGAPAQSESISKVMDAIACTALPMMLALTTVVMYHISSACLHARKIQGSIISLPIDSVQKRHLLTAAEVSCLGIMSSLCSPLVSFVVYFCLWHSFRHIMVVSCTILDDKNAQRALAMFFLQASPFTLATLAIAWFSWEQMMDLSPGKLAESAARGGLSPSAGEVRDLSAIAQVG